MSGYDVAIVCGKGKMAHATKVADLYTSSFLRNAVAWARSVDARIWIMSGGLGFIAGDTVVEPYEADPMTGSVFANDNRPHLPYRYADPDQCRAMIEASGVRGTVTAIGGGDYLKRFAYAGRGLVRFARPFYALALDRHGDGRIGYQTHQMKLWRGRWPVPGRDYPVAPAVVPVPRSVKQ